MPKLIICLGFLILTSMAHAQSIEVSASVDKNPVMEGESFILSVVANGEVKRDAFDASILDERLCSRPHVSQLANKNGQLSTPPEATTWSTDPDPKQTKGRYTIPRL